MNLVVCGLNHHSAPVEIRERLAFTEKDLPAAFSLVREKIPGAGCVLVSTCNRVEIYVHHPLLPETLRERLVAFLVESRGVEKALFDDYLYLYAGREAVEHLFRVASGLDSLVIGEPQILGQLHEAYQAAHACQVADKVIHRLFQKAFTTAKKVRSQTAIGMGNVSVSSVAVSLAASIFKDLSRVQVFLLGSGEMAALALKALADHGARHITVVNRDLEKARILAASQGGTVATWDELDGLLTRADIVISSTAAPGFILSKKQVDSVLHTRKHRPLFLVDIATPRDIDPEVASLDGVFLYDIDDLKAVARHNQHARQEEIDRCIVLIEQATERFMAWLASLPAESALCTLARELDAIQKEELARVFAAIPELSSEARAEIESFARRSAERILQQANTDLYGRYPKQEASLLRQFLKRLLGIEKKKETFRE